MGVIKLNIDVDLASFKQLKMPDYSELSHIIMVAKGFNRSMEQFAKDCGVSPATFSRITTGRRTKPLDKDLIKKIADQAEDKDQRDYILLSLLNANGMVDETTGEDKNSLQNYQNEKLFDLQNKIKNIIMAGLLKKGYTVKYLRDMVGEPVVANRLIAGFRSNEILLKIPDREPMYYSFQIYASLADGFTGMNAPLTSEEGRHAFEAWYLLEKTAPLFLYDVWNPDGFKYTRTTIVLNDKHIFREFIKLMDNKKVNSQMAILLVNEKKEEVEYEWDLHMKNDEFFSPLFYEYDMEEDAIIPF